MAIKNNITRQMFHATLYIKQLEIRILIQLVQSVFLQIGVPPGLNMSTDYLDYQMNF